MADHKDDHDKRIEDPRRRDFLLTATTAVVGAVGVCGAAWPLIASMNPSRDVQAKATSLVDISSIPKGKTHTVEWQGKPVFVVHRTEEEIRAMQQNQGGKDPQEDGKRVQRNEWLVVVGICTHLGCVPNRTDAGWSCPCHGSIYDNSGRILQGPAPRNLEVPHYTFLGDDKIIIGKA